MTDKGISSNSKLSSTDRLLAKFGIRPEEKSVTALMFSNMFMSGIAIGMIRVCAFTLFLEHWESNQLALIAILIALVGMPMTLVIDILTRGLGIRNYLFTLLGVILSGLTIMRLSLELSDSRYLIFSLPLFFELIYMLFSLQFVALLSRLLNVRQAKRLSGIARSGEFLAELAGGLLVIILLRFMQVTDLLIVAMLTTLVVFIIVGYIVVHFQEALDIGTDSPEAEWGQSLLGMLRLPYVRLITFCYIAYMFAYFFLEVAFYDYASAQYPDEKTLAAFIAQFYAVAGFLTMLTMVFLFAPFLRKFSIIAGIIAFPVIIFVGSSAVTAMEYLGLPGIFIFTVMVVTNGLRVILQSAIWKSSVTILFQVLPDTQRSKGIALTEGVIDPVAGGLAGVCLYILTTNLGFEPRSFLLILSGLMLAWILMGFLVRKLYLSNLMLSIQKRKLGEISLTDLDNASLDIIKAGLRSQYPAQIFYCLNLLEAIRHPEITDLLYTLLNNPNRHVRKDVLQRIANKNITPLQARVSDRIEEEPDPTVRGQALKTYATLSSPDTKLKLKPYLKANNQELRKGALVGLLTYDSKDEKTIDNLRECVGSLDPGERIFAADIIGEVGNGNFSNFLVDLLKDIELQVQERAILAAGKLGDPGLVNILVNKLSVPSLLGTTSVSLKQFGDTALHKLDMALSTNDPSRQEKLHIIETIREIGGEQSTNTLLRHTDIPEPELRHQVYLGLATLQYQAGPDDQSRFVNSMEREIQIITWLLATMNDISDHADYKTLSAALGNELEIREDVLLLILSFLFPSAAILNARANIDSKVSQRRVFALEVLDNILSSEVKEIVLPILDDLSLAEKLEQVSIRFPQKQMAPVVRFGDIVGNHYERAFFWTRSCILYQIGTAQSQGHTDKIILGLHDKESIIRETAVWCLGRLHSAELKSLLKSLMDDTSPTVSALARDIYRTLPEPG